MIFSKKIPRSIGMLCAFVLAAGGCTAVIWRMHTHSTDQALPSNTLYVMDTICTITAPESLQEPLAETMRQLDDQLDCYDAESVVSRCNQSGTSQDTMLYDLVTQVQTAQRQDGAKVDVTIGALTALWGITTDHPKVPTAAQRQQALATVSPEHVTAKDGTVSLSGGAQLDFGAVAKGYAMDQAAAVLNQSDASYAIVSMESSMVLYGAKPNGKPFVISVRDPDGEGILGTIETPACFLSTSGGYERYFTAEDGTAYEHILDPQTGMPVETDLKTVTVLCDSGLRSDLLSTEIYMEGTAGLERHLQATDYQVLAEDQNGQIYVSNGLHFTKRAD